MSFHHLIHNLQLLVQAHISASQNFRLNCVTIVTRQKQSRGHKLQYKLISIANTTTYYYSLILYTRRSKISTVSISLLEIVLFISTTSVINVTSLLVSVECVVFIQFKNFTINSFYKALSWEINYFCGCHTFDLSNKNVIVFCSN